MPSALNQLIKCLTLCKTKCHCKSKCSNCMELELDFQEGPQTPNNLTPQTSSEIKQHNKKHEQNVKLKSNNNVKNAGSITSDL